MVLAGRLLRALAPLARPPLGLARALEAYQPRANTLPVLAADLYAAALLDFQGLQAPTRALLSLARLRASEAPPARCAAELAAAAQAWLRHEASADALWLADWASELLAQTAGPQHDLMPVAERGLLRSVFAAMPKDLTLEALASSMPMEAVGR